MILAWLLKPKNLVIVFLTCALLGLVGLTLYYKNKAKNLAAELKEIKTSSEITKEELEETKKNIDKRIAEIREDYRKREQEERKKAEDQRKKLKKLEDKIVLYNKKISPERTIPEFPWPPPEASAREIIPNQLLLKPDAQKPCLSDVDEKLHAAFRSCGYSEISYFSVPAGFAMVSRLEQINDNGTPKEIPDRWAKDVLPVDSISLRKILRALFTANPGYYRLIVFIVTPTPFSDVGAKVSREETETWLHRGLNVLPPSIGKIAYTKETACTALIYEFEQPAAGKQAVIKLPGRLTGEIHLRKNNLLQALGG
jgi:hypothetical protein